MKKIYFVLLIAAVLIVGGYSMQYDLRSRLSCTLDCPPELNTYKGPSWPALLPDKCTCGWPRPPSLFFQDVLSILIPAIFALIVYGAYLIIYKLTSLKKQ